MPWVPRTDGFLFCWLTETVCTQQVGLFYRRNPEADWIFCNLWSFFLFFFPQPFSSPLKKESYRGLTSSVNALDMLDDESSFSSQTQCIFSHPLKRWISDEATRPKIARSLPPESRTVSLFSPSVLRHDACTVAARKVWCIVGKVIHWLREYLSIQAVRWSIVVAVGADKRPTVCVAGVQRRPWSFEKKIKNCQLNSYFLSLCFFCTSLPVFSSARGATDATSRKICFKAKWQYLF